MKKLAFLIAVLIAGSAYAACDQWVDGRCHLDVDVLQFQQGESVETPTGQDGVIKFYGQRGIADTDLSIDLDGLGPTLYSQTDSVINFDDNLLLGDTLKLQLGNTSTYLTKDASGNLSFTDSVTGTKTLAELAIGLPVTDTTAIVKGSDDDTKQVRFEVDGITTGATRVLTVPDKDITIAGIDDIPSTTDDLSEGSTNLYYTNARVDAHLSGGTGISYSSGTISLSHLGLENLSDPNANRLYYWNDTNNTTEWLDYSNWDTDKTDDLLSADLDTEAELENQLTNVTNVYTNNDGSLSDDDLSDNSINDLSDVDTTGVANGKVLKYNSTSNKWEIGDDNITFPAGSDGQLQYNDGGSFGGTSGLTWDDANNELTIPKGYLTTTPTGSADIKSLVNKEYVDLAVTSLGASYYMHDEDDATGYKTCYLSPSSSAETYIEKSNLADDDYIGGWISAVGEAPAKLLKGVYNWYITLEKTSGTKTLRVYWKLIERKSDNSETVIATSSNSNEIDTKANYLVPLQLDDDYIPDSGSRIVGKLYADVSGGGSAPTIKVYYQGNTSSRWEIPANSEIFKTIFVPYDGAVEDVDLGSYDLTTVGTIDGGAVKVNGVDVLTSNTSFGGDVSGTYNSTSVDKIKGKSVDDTNIADGKVLKYNSTSGNLEYQDDNNTTYTADGEGLELSGTQFSLELDGTTLSKSASGLKVSSITSSEIADGTIQNADIADDTLAESKLDIYNAPTDGYYLKYTSANGMEWAIGGGASQLDDLSDVTISSPTDNQLLKYVTDHWENWTPDYLTELSQDTTPQLGGDLDAQSHKITNLSDPTNDQDAATKAYADNTMEKVSEVNVSSDRTYVDFTGLDGDSDWFYMLICTFKNPATSSCNYYIFVNGDTTTSNYYAQWIRGSGTTTESNRANSPRFAQAVANNRCMAHTIMGRDGDGYFRAEGQFTMYQGSSVEAFLTSVSKSATTSNITSLRVQASVSNGIGADSKLILFKVRR